MQPHSNDTLPWLRPIVSVKRQEVVALVGSMVWLFAALAAYYVLKPIRSVMLQTRIGVDHKGAALLLTTLFVALETHLYGALVPRVSRALLLKATFLVFIATLGGFAFALERTSSPALGYAFYVWVSTFNLLVVSQFWSFATDIWSQEEAERLFGFIGVGAVCGGIGGNLLMVALARRLTTSQLLGISAALLACCLGIASWLTKWAARSRATPDLAVQPHIGATEAKGSAQMVASSPYLLRIALMTLLLNVVNTSNEWVLDKAVAASNLGAGSLKAFYGRYQLEQNMLAVGIQLFVTSRFQRRFGARAALLCLPTVSALGGLGFAAAPSLRAIVTLKVVENATDYSIHANTRELLYVPVSPLEKYSAKNFNDTFVVRVGDSIAAALILVLGEAFGPQLLRDGLAWLVAGSAAIAILAGVVVLRVTALHRRTQPPK